MDRSNTHSADGDKLIAQLAELRADRDAWMARATALQVKLDETPCPPHEKGVSSLGIPYCVRCAVDWDRLVAGQGETDRARAFFAAWGLVASPRSSTLHDGTIVLKSNGPAAQQDAMAALAQAFADEQASGGACAILEGREKWSELARRALGLISDVQKLDAGMNAALDDYAMLGGAVARTVARLATVATDRHDEDGRRSSVIPPAPEHIYARRAVQLARSYVDPQSALAALFHEFGRMRAREADAARALAEEKAGRG